MKWILGFMLWLPILVYADNNTSRALEAFKAANYKLAEQFWMYAANQGDSVAQYNLAYLYHNGIGVDADDTKAKRMLRTAAQANLVDAYNRVLPDAVQPATVEDGLQAIAVTDPQIWVKTQDSENYTLQLASSRSQELIKKYFDDNELAGKAGYYKSKRQGEYWYALVYGSFKSVSDANDAIANLPKDLRKWSPWVRRLDSIQKITTP
jgi:septal ring-binding cell division protein DamX